MTFIGSDGVPTRLYDQFRNSETQADAVAQGLRTAYAELFDRNEYVYETSREKLTGLVVEVTGRTKDDSATRQIVSTFSTLNELADFDASVGTETETDGSAAVDAPTSVLSRSQTDAMRDTNDVKLGVSYTINLNLPETTDPDVFNAIFRALKEHLLKS